MLTIQTFLAGTEKRSFRKMMFKKVKPQAIPAKEMFVEYLIDTPEEKIHRIINFR
jgi:hypothetical protein